MLNHTFTAVTDDGRRLPFAVETTDGRLQLTLKKEVFSDAKALTMLGDFTQTPAGTDGFYLLPRSISMTGDIQTFFTPRADLSFHYEKPVLSCFAIQRPAETLLFRVERNYKFGYTVTVRENIYSLTLDLDLKDPQKDTAYDDIRIEVLLLPADASLGDIAAAERNLRLERGEITPLAEKCTRSAVEYARTHPLVRIRMGWKPSPSPVWHQTLENEPEMYTACTFARVRDLIDALIAAGCTGADLQLVGWNISGHDGRFPQLFPVDPRLGGEEELRKTIAYAKKMGFRISLHTNLIDAYEIADSFDWNNIVQTSRGDYLRIGHYSGGLAYHVCPTAQERVSADHMRQIDPLAPNGIHFTDVISIVEPDSCHAPEHPSTTADGIRTACRIMNAVRARRGAFSSEGCFDFAVPCLDYGLYVSFGNGFGDRRPPIMDRDIPFWELVYHGIMLYNPTSPTVNFPIKSADDHLTFILRGGRASMYIYSKFRTGGAKNWMGDDDLTVDTDDDLSAAASAIASAEHECAPLARLQTVYMTDYTINDGLHIAAYADGTRIAGNFSGEERFVDGTAIPAHGYAVL
ncbi:MAG: hypothetical protein IJC15_00065 [Clostridia bacterium]|nr:hypothetical protein [Clostridia bacterium]